jgi:hypothetical protein
MKVDRPTTSYLIFFSQDKKVQRTPVTGISSDDELPNIIRLTFKGRFRRPPSLTYKDGVRIVVKRLDHVSHTVRLVMSTVIYNKSVRQARIEVEKAIMNQ